MTKLIMEGRVPPLPDDLTRRQPGAAGTEDEVPLDIEDSGMALITEFGNDGEVFVRLQSWDETRAHTSMRHFSGQNVRITVEVVPDDDFIA